MKPYRKECFFHLSSYSWLFIRSTDTFAGGSTLTRTHRVSQSTYQHTDPAHPFTIFHNHLPHFQKFSVAFVPFSSTFVGTIPGSTLKISVVPPGVYRQRRSTWHTSLSRSALSPAVLQGSLHKPRGAPLGLIHHINRMLPLPGQISSSSQTPFLTTIALTASCPHRHPSKKLPGEARLSRATHCSCRLLSVSPPSWSAQTLGTGSDC